jgi:hypothetical protein
MPFVENNSVITINLFNHQNSLANNINQQESSGEYYQLAGQRKKDRETQVRSTTS